MTKLIPAALVALALTLTACGGPDVGAYVATVTEGQQTVGNTISKSVGDFKADAAAIDKFAAKLDSVKADDIPEAVRSSHDTLVAQVRGAAAAVRSCENNTLDECKSVLNLHGQRIESTLRDISTDL